jgi:uncharacterized membrane protein (DUF373 family)
MPILPLFNSLLVGFTVNKMKGWKITGLIAALVIVLSISIYFLKARHASWPDIPEG